MHSGSECQAALGWPAGPASPSRSPRVLQMLVLVLILVLQVLVLVLILQVLVLVLVLVLQVLVLVAVLAALEGVALPVPPVPPVQPYTRNPVPWRRASRSRATSGWRARWSRSGP